jgi:iron complex outermembrane recepter protein
MKVATKVAVSACRIRHSPLALAVAVAVAVCLMPACVAAGETLTLDAIDVVATTPQGAGIDRSHLPYRVLSADAADLEQTQSLSLPDFMATRLPGVTINEVQGNPLQPDVNYRGFTASPLLGTAQGLAVYVDGVRANEPFGDTVNWDLIPRSAIAGFDLMPGSNPAFGLNALGGALAVRTKSGDRDPGTRLEAGAGSFGRRTASFEHGGSKDELAWFTSVDSFDEDGWRDHSQSSARQYFGKLSWRGERLDADLSLMHANTDLIGNGLLPYSLYGQDRSAVFTYPDNTRNEFTQLTANSGYWLDDRNRLGLTAYYRNNLTRTLNGDVNDDFAGSENDGACDPADFAAGSPEQTQCIAANAAGGFNTGSGAYNRTRTRQRSYGGTLQWERAGEQHRLTAGVSADVAYMNFRQSVQLGVLNSQRGVDLSDDEEIENQLASSSRQYGVFVSDSVTLASDLYLTGAARFNLARIRMRDQLNATTPNLDGDHHYSKFNPALGLSWQAQPALTVYAGASQSNRVPTPIELGCADPDHPCTLPNAMASDPHLEQVVARTLEAGLRGQLVGGVSWNAGVFRTVSSNDILFVGTSTSAGYFTNYGRTRRQGVELGVSGDAGSWSWYATYNYLDATFRSSACVLSENNSTRGQAAACSGAGQDDEILVEKGDRLPGIPEHSLKLGVVWQAGERWHFGADLQAFSGQYARGNENNQHQAGTYTDIFGTTRTYEGSGWLPGYAIFNVDGEYRAGRGLSFFARIVNLFDKRYGTAAALAENPFDASGAFLTDSSTWRHETFLSPGTPRAIWVGLRYRFDG